MSGTPHNELLLWVLLLGVVALLGVGCVIVLRRGMQERDTNPLSACQITCHGVP